MMHMTWLLTFMIKSDLVVSAVLCPHGRTDVLSLNKRRKKKLRFLYHLLKVFYYLLFVPSTEPNSRYRECCNLERGLECPCKEKAERLFGVSEAL